MGKAELFRQTEGHVPYEACGHKAKDGFCCNLEKGHLGAHEFWDYREDFPNLYGYATLIVHGWDEDGNKLTGDIESTVRFFDNGRFMQFCDVEA